MATAPAPDAAISVQRLTKRYGALVAVRDLSFSFCPGEIFALLGPNGAGKTTTVEILEGYRAADEGEVRVLGLDPIRQGRALKPRIGLMLQQGGVYPQIRPLEALRLFASFYADPHDPVALLDLVGLREAVHTTYRQLSGGQKQRLSLALALVGRPEVLFLDEPTAAMDPQARRATWDLILAQKRQGVTVLLTTHFMEEAERLADRVAIVDRGRLVALDTPDQLARQSAAREIRFSAAPGLDTAALADHLAAAAVLEPEPGRYVVEAEVSPTLLARLAAWLAERSVLLRDLHVERRSLEDVYLRLTGAKSEE
ncbi:MAG: ABC transporter ATP-binding protein [Chloroflexi bacterium]|nr:ABC transporter ATP-binding protein [Chloroflexota bacterium]